MSDVVLNAEAVGQVVTYVAPGFLARFGYRARYPGPDRPAGEVLILSVVVSLPFVALVSAVLRGAQRPSDLGYVALLAATAMLVGYTAAWLRGRPGIRRLLGRAGYRLQPSGTIYAATLAVMSEDATVVVELKDGRRIWGCPRQGPQHKDDGVNELYLTYPKAEAGGDWLPVGEGIIVPLGEVSTITLSEEPAGADAERVRVPSETVPA